MLFITSAVHNKKRQTEFVKIVQFVLVKIKYQQSLMIIKLCSTQLYLDTLRCQQYNNALLI